MTAQTQPAAAPQIEITPDALAPHHAKALAASAGSAILQTVLQYALQIALPLILQLIGADPTLYPRYQAWHAGQGDATFSTGPLLPFTLKIDGVKSRIGLTLTRQ